MTSALLAAFHYLALAIGPVGLVLRGDRLRRLRDRPEDGDLLAGVFRADGLWGMAAMLWLATGLYRAFGGVDKAAAFYLRNGFFHLKMTLFVAVFALEILPMVTLIRWRIAQKRGAPLDVATRLPRLVRLNDLELVVLLCIPVAAACMARGLWLF